MHSGYRQFFSYSVWALLLLLALESRAQEKSQKSNEAGLALHLGAGFVYGGNLGLLIENQFLFQEKFRLSPFASFGIAEGGKDPGKMAYFWCGAVTGLHAEYGRKHRLFFGPEIGMQVRSGESIEEKKDRLPFVSFILGYKGTADFGLIWQVYIGNVYIQESMDIKKDFSNQSHAGIGIGYKF
jgi:hypothetical protein